MSNGPLYLNDIDAGLAAVREAGRQAAMDDNERVIKAVVEMCSTPPRQSETHRGKNRKQRRAEQAKNRKYNRQVDKLRSTLEKWACTA